METTKTTVNWQKFMYFKRKFGVDSPYYIQFTQWLEGKDDCKFTSGYIRAFLFGFMETNEPDFTPMYELIDKYFEEYLTIKGDKYDSTRFESKDGK